MRYTEIDQETTSIEWCAIDLEGNIGRFDSAGVNLPEIITINKESNEACVNYLKSINIPCDYKVADNLYNPEYYHNYNIYSKSYKVLERDVKLESSGCFLFEIVDSLERANPLYFCICIPSPPLKFYDLPSYLQKKLKKLRYEGIFNESLLIKNTDFGSVQ